MEEEGDGMLDEGQTLGNLFLIAQQLFNDIESSSLPGGDPSFQAQVKKALVAIMRANMIADRVGVISSNEEAEDVSAKDLRFVLLPYYRGVLLLKLVENRIAVLKNAEMAFDQFLKNCDQLALLDKGIQSRAIVERDEPLGPAAARQERIQRYREEKAFKARLEEVTRLLEQSSMKEDHVVDEDDDLHREHWKLLIHVGIHAALTELSSLRREKEMLEAMEKMRGEEHGKRAPGSMRKPPPVRYPPGVVPVRETITIDKRGMIRKGMFRDRNPPTMSVEEYLELERQRGGIIEGGGEPPEKEENEEYGEKDEQTAEAEQRKAREWADWVDEHPKGAGNTKGNLG